MGAKAESYTNNMWARKALEDIFWVGLGGSITNIRVWSNKAHHWRGPTVKQARIKKHHDK